MRGRLRALRLVSALLLLVASGGELLLRAATMSGAGPGAAVAAVPAVLARTHFGAIWSARAVMLLALLALAGARSRAWRLLGALLALGVAATVTLTGHAADWGDVSITATLDWAHVVAATTWAGGLFVARDARAARRAAVAAHAPARGDAPLLDASCVLPRGRGPDRRVPGLGRAARRWPRSGRPPTGARWR